MKEQKKCSLKKHAEINAISYCQECDKYMYNKCENLHNDLFEEHHKYNLNENINEFFTGKCKEPNHKIELNFFCKNHNKLCCSSCITKIKEKGYGQHNDCDVCLIDNIKDEKKNKLAENVKILEELSNKVENSINELKKIIENINDNKEELKLKISKKFTQIRNFINQREDELLLEVDNKFNKLYFDEDFINKNKNLPNKIKNSLEKGNLINKEWDNNKIKLNSIINDCLIIENNINKIIEINKNIEKYNSINKKIFFVPDNEKEINAFFNIIKKFGEIKEQNELNANINTLKTLKFKFKPGQNYSVSNYGLMATKDKGGDNWNCTIIGDKEIPKNKVSEWKIKITNFKIKNNSINIFIGIGPDNPNNETSFYHNCWNFSCGESQIAIKTLTRRQYNNYNKNKLNMGDIIKVIVDRKLGNLSFEINGENYGIASSNIPKDDILFPIVIINDQGQIVEIVE